MDSVKTNENISKKLSQKSHKLSIYGSKQFNQP